MTLVLWIRGPRVQPPRHWAFPPHPTRSPPPDGGASWDSPQPPTPTGTQSPTSAFQARGQCSSRNRRIPRRRSAIAGRGHVNAPAPRRPPRRRRASWPRPRAAGRSPRASAGRSGGPSRSSRAGRGSPPRCTVADLAVIAVVLFEAASARRGAGRSCAEQESSAERVLLAGICFWRRGSP